MGDIQKIDNNDGINSFNSYGDNYNIKDGLHLNFPKLPLLQKILNDVYEVRKALYKFTTIVILLISIAAIGLSLYNISIQHNTDRFFTLLAESAGIFSLLVIYYFFNKLFYIRVEKYKFSKCEQIFFLGLFDFFIWYYIFKLGATCRFLQTTNNLS